jgi:hypothetical protein
MICRKWVQPNCRRSADTIFSSGKYAGISTDAADEAEITSEFDQELLELFDQAALQIRLRSGCRIR